MTFNTEQHPSTLSNQLQADIANPSSLLSSMRIIQLITQALPAWQQYMPAHCNVSLPLAAVVVRHSTASRWPDGPLDITTATTFHVTATGGAPLHVACKQTHRIPQRVLFQPLIQMPKPWLLASLADWNCATFPQGEQSRSFSVDKP